MATIQSWQPFPSSINPLARVKRNIPHIPDGNALQNLTIYVPTPTPPLPTSNTADNTTIPGQQQSRGKPTWEATGSTGYWIIYIHGGAWRDPLQSSTTFDNTVAHLLQPQPPSTAPSSIPKAHITALASLNYTLSRYPPPSHLATSPADEAARSGRHPDHIRDVRLALRYLQQAYGFGNRYILVGHSCGATIAWQVVMGLGEEGESDERESEASERENEESEIGHKSTKGVVKPAAIIGVNGLYHLPLLLSDPGPKHNHLISAYREILTGAFGSDPDIWEGASPTLVTGGPKAWEERWPEGKVAFIAGSMDDELVDWHRQGGALVKSSGGVWGGDEDEGEISTFPSPNYKTLRLWKKKITGAHDEIWMDGREMAALIDEALEEVEYKRKAGRLG